MRFAWVGIAVASESRWQEAGASIIKGTKSSTHRSAVRVSCLVCACVADPWQTMRHSSARASTRQPST